MKDYVACALEKDGGRVGFASHFCFAETDVNDWGKGDVAN